MNPNNTVNWPKSRRAAVGATDGENFFVFGGCLDGDGDDATTTNELLRFNPPTETWSRLSNHEQTDYSSVGVPGSRRYPSLDYHNGSLFLFGGCGEDDEYFLLNDLWEFDLDKRSWINREPHVPIYTSSSTRPPVRYTHCTTVWEDTLYVFSGWYRNRDTKDRHCLNDFWGYDFNSREWNLIHEPADAWGYDQESAGPGERYGAMADRVGHQFFVFGGWSEFRDHNDLWRYDLRDNSWSCIFPETDDSQLPEHRYCGSLDSVDTDLYLTTGRSRSNPNLKYSDLWRFNTITYEWKRIQPSTKEFGGPSYFGKNAHAAIGKDIYYFAGESGENPDNKQLCHTDNLWVLHFPDASWMKVD